MNYSHLHIYHILPFSVRRAFYWNFRQGCSEKQSLLKDALLPLDDSFFKNTFFNNTKRPFVTFSFLAGILQLCSSVKCVLLWRVSRIWMLTCASLADGDSVWPLLSSVLEGTHPWLFVQIYQPLVFSPHLNYVVYEVRQFIKVTERAWTLLLLKTGCKSGCL